MGARGTCLRERVSSDLPKLGRRQRRLPQAQQLVSISSPGPVSSPARRTDTPPSFQREPDPLDCPLEAGWQSAMLDNVLALLTDPVQFF